MVAVIGGISVFLEDDTARFQQSMTRNAALVEQQTARMTRSLGNTARSVDDLNRRAAGFQPDAFRALAVSALRAETSIQRLRASMLAITALATGGFAGAFATKVLVDTADAYSTVQNKIAAVVDGTKERAAAEREIYEISQRTRTGYQDTATLFQRLTLSSSSLKASQGEILRVVETVQKSLVTGGATVQEAAGAAVQLTQALGAGRLQGDELRSILENAPLLAQAIAREFGVAVGDLKAMGSEGQLTSDRVFRALLKAGDQVEERFRQMKPTVAQSLVVLDNAFTRYIGQADQSLGATAALAQGIISLSENLNDLGAAAVAVAPLLAGVFAARMVNRGTAAAQAPYRAEFARRDEALAQARAAEQMAAERVVSAGGQAAELRSRARSDIDSFADKAAIRDRERVRATIEKDTADLQAAQARFREVAGRNAGIDIASVTRSAEAIYSSSDLKDLRDNLRGAQTELSSAENEISRTKQQAIDKAERLGKQLVAIEQSIADQRMEIVRRAEATAGNYVPGASPGTPTPGKIQLTENERRAFEAFLQARAQNNGTQAELHTIRSYLDGLSRQEQDAAFKGLQQKDVVAFGEYSSPKTRAKVGDAAVNFGAGALHVGMARPGAKDVDAVTEELGRQAEGRARGVKEVERLIEQEIKAQERLDQLMKQRDGITAAVIQTEEQAANRVVESSKRVEEAKRKVADADRAIRSVVVERVGEERGAANRRLMAEVADAAAARQTVQNRLDLDKELLQASDQEVRQNAVANATKAVGAAQQQATIAAAGYRQAQEGVAVAAARTGAATTVLSTTLKLAASGFGALYAFLGGPIGVAFTALSVGVSMYAVTQMKAAEAARDHADALAKLAVRLKEVNDSTAKGQVLSQADTVKYRQLQKGALRSLNDERDTLVGLGRRLQRNYDFRDPNSAVGQAALATGLNMSDALVNATTKAPASEQGRKALEDIRDLLVAVANVDPRFGKDADAAMDSYIRLRDGIKTVMEAETALRASQATKPIYDSPLDSALFMAPKFDGTAAKAAVASFVTEIKGSITELSETRIEFPSLSTSREQLADFATTIGQARADAAGLVSQKVVPNDLYDAVAAFAAGKTSVEDYATSLQELKLANPSFGPLIDSLIASNEKALAARATLAGLGIDISKLDGMVANVLVKIGVSGDAKEIGEAISAEAAKGAKVVADLEAKTRNMRLRADGKSAEATTNEIMAQSPTADRAAVARNVQEQEDLQKRISALGRKGRKQPKSEEEKFADRLERLQEEGRAAFFTDTDRALIEELKKIKGEPALLRSTVDAIKEGKPLPEQAQRLRDALVMKEAGKEYREVVQAYGSADQILPEVNAKQEKLNMLLAAGKITADQYGLAMADTLSKYQNYRWIDQTAEALGGFAGELGEAAFGFKSFDDVANSFIQTIVRLGIQIALVQPLINMLKSGLAAGATGGDPLSFIGNLVGAIAGGGSGGLNFSGDMAGAVGSFEILHEGGLAGSGGRKRSMPLGLLAGAPRFHGGNLGLAPDEIPAILQRGEPVLSRRTARNLSSAIGQLSEMEGGGGGEMTVNVHPPAGTTPQVQKRRTPTGQSADVFIRSVIGADLAGNGPLAQAMQEMYGLNRMSGKQT